MSLPIPVIETSGTAFEVGHQIGTAARASLTNLRDQTRAEYGARWRSLLDRAAPFYDASLRHLPKVVDELRGCAEGSALPFDELFLMSVEELLYDEVRGANGR